jgi:hypothetical protein
MVVRTLDLPRTTPPEPECSHQPFDGAAGDRDALALELGPDLLGPIEAAMLRPDPPDSSLKRFVPSLAG